MLVIVSLSSQIRLAEYLTENIWDDMREKFFGNLMFHSMEAVEERLCEAARVYEGDPEKVKSMAG